MPSQTRECHFRPIGGSVKLWPSIAQHDLVGWGSARLEHECGHQRILSARHVEANVKYARIDDVLAEATPREDSV